MTNTHPNSIYRWEDSASLEHACWQCPTKANSPRALQTCYGVHSMPCISYHPTMHAVGAAHRCSGCVITREMHDARHREIADLVAEYKALDHAIPETPTRVPLSERNVNLNAVDPPGLGRKSLRSIDIVPFDNQENVEDKHKDGSASTSSYTPSSIDNLTIQIGKPTRAEVRAQKKAKKTAKSQNKALRNQNRNLASVTMADVDDVAEILHGEERDMTLNGAAHPLATDKTIEDVINRNLNFVRNIQAHKEYLFKSVAAGRRETKERKRVRKRESLGETTESAIEMDEVVSAIMIRLGISPNAVSASTSTSSSATNSSPLRAATNTVSSGRKRAALGFSLTPSSSGGKDNSSASRSATAVATRLRSAIRIDLEKHENEVHARYVRAGGFWRYVGKTVFERMTDVARDLDVSSGEKWNKKKAREERVCANKEVHTTPNEAY